MGRFGVRIRSGQQEDTPLKKHRLVLFSVSTVLDAGLSAKVSIYFGKV